MLCNREIWIKLPQQKEKYPKQTCNIADELLSNDQRAVAFSSNQLVHKDTSVRGEGNQHGVGCQA